MGLIPSNLEASFQPSSLARRGVIAHVVTSQCKSARGERGNAFVEDIKPIGPRALIAM